MIVPDEEGNFEPHRLHGIEPSYAWPTLIPHYYGDAVRELFLGGAALMLIASPLYATNLRTEFPFEVLGAFLAVGFGALTNPHNRWVMICDTIVAGTGLVVYAGWALMEYETINPVAFVLRIAIAALCLFAFYFSVKTVRAMSLHQIGKHESVDEFDEDREKGSNEDTIPEALKDSFEKWEHRAEKK